MVRELENFLPKPELYTPSSIAFWDDPHISEGMLNAHLEPDSNASSRKHDFIDNSVESQHQNMFVMNIWVTYTLRLAQEVKIL